MAMLVCFCWGRAEDMHTYNASSLQQFKHAMQHDKCASIPSVGRSTWALRGADTILISKPLISISCMPVIARQHCEGTLLAVNLRCQTHVWLIKAFFVHWDRDSHLCWERRAGRDISVWRADIVTQLCRGCVCAGLVEISWDACEEVSEAEGDAQAVEAQQLHGGAPHS